jgi:type IV secretory pathway VirB2 component (pilin)
MQINIFLSKFLLILSCLFILQLSSIESALAVDPPASGSSNSQDTRDELSCTLKRIVDVLTGPMGKAIASLAIIALGIGLFLGKLSWGLAVATALGIAMIFGAPNIVDWLSGNQFQGNIICTPAVNKTK